MLALGGWGALESWVAAQKIAAAQEMIRRRPADPKLLAALAARTGTRVAAPDPHARPLLGGRRQGEGEARELCGAVYWGVGRGGV